MPSLLLLAALLLIQVMMPLTFSALRFSGLAAAVRHARRSAGRGALPHPSPPRGPAFSPAAGRRLWRALLTAVRSCACPAMSRSSRAVLVVTALLSAATIVAVHVQQRRERERLHSGVLRDLERQNQKRENIRLLEEQIALTKRLTEEREKMLMEKGSQQS
uniref:PET117 cytochrome c oxidase chaperone n=2 Tax=Phasianus colchicus TaxID=9054 RepID=A0A669P3Z0_PHACC